MLDIMKRKNLATLLHIILCNKTHTGVLQSSIEIPGQCSWYAEETVQDEWEQSEHKRWLVLADYAMPCLNSSQKDPIELLRIIKDLGMSIYNATKETTNALRHDFMHAVLAYALPSL